MSIIELNIKFRSILGRYTKKNLLSVFEMDNLDIIDFNLKNKKLKSSQHLIHIKFNNINNASNTRNKKTDEINLFMNIIIIKEIIIHSMN